MEYNYYANEDYYEYLASGVKAWDLLLPNNIGLKKEDTVKVIEVDNNGEETGKAISGTIHFNGVDGIMTVSGNKDFYYITNLIPTNMFTEIIALISQGGASDPTSMVLKNTTGKTLNWSRDDIGNYGLDLGGGIDYDKMFVILGQGILEPNFINYTTNSGGYDFRIFTSDITGNLTDGLLDKNSMIIRFYS